MAKNKITRALWEYCIPLFTIDACLISLCSVGANSCFNASSRMVERHFDFTSTQTSLLMVGDEISAFASLIFGYLGGKFHKPRFLGVMVILLGLSYITLTIPYYISATSSDTMTDVVSGNETITSTNLTKLPDILCRKPTDNSSCLIDERLNNNTSKQRMNNQNMFYIFLVGKMLVGAFYGTILTMPFVYLNENCVTSKATFFGGMKDC